MGGRKIKSHVDPSAIAWVVDGQPALFIGLSPSPGEGAWGYAIAG